MTGRIMASLIAAALALGLVSCAAGPANVQSGAVAPADEKERAAANVAAAASVAVATAGSGVAIRPKASKSVN